VARVRVRAQPDGLAAMARDWSSLSSFATQVQLEVHAGLDAGRARVDSANKPLPA
jgi:hypothetical protein